MTQAGKLQRVESRRVGTAPHSGLLPPFLRLKGWEGTFPDPGRKYSYRELPSGEV